MKPRRPLPAGKAPGRPSFLPPATGEKREELRTYRELALKRDLKSARQRRRVEARSGGGQRVIGDGSLAQPWLTVPRTRYEEERARATTEKLRAAQAGGIELPIEVLLELLHGEIERQTYAQLARELAQGAQGNVPLPALGRGLTAQEKKRFAQASALASAPPTRADLGATEPAEPGSPTQRALTAVLGRIEQRQSHNPARYQTLWAQVVGGEVAQQTCLEAVDPVTGTAWIRCLNSVLSAHLQRRTDLPALLSKALKIPVRQVRARW